MRSRFAAAMAAVAVIAVALTGCGGLGADAGSDPNNPNQVEVFTWWASGNEKASYKELVEVFAEQNPDIQFIDASVRGSGGAQARAAIAARLESNNPPDSFQAAAGAGLTDYIDAGQIQDLTSWYAENGLSAGVYRAALLELLSVDGKVYSVPSEIHRVNVRLGEHRPARRGRRRSRCGTRQHRRLDRRSREGARIGRGIPAGARLGLDPGAAVRERARLRPRRRAVPEPLEEHEELGG